MREVLASLQEVGAPAALVAWVRRVGERDAWDGCGRGDWLVWMAACQGAPLDSLGRVVLETLQAVLERLEDAEPLRVLGQGLEAALDGQVEALADHADRCEALAEGAPQSYRSALPGGFEALARGVALALRSADALAAARAALEARLAQDALERAAGIGVAPALLQREVGPLFLSDQGPRGPLGEELLYAVDAAAEALAETALALSADDATTLASAQETVSELVFESLDALVRDDLSG